MSTSNIWKNETVNVNTHNINVQQPVTVLEYLGIISFVDGWSGGTLFIDNKPVSEYNLNDCKLVSIIGDIEFTSKLITRAGNDSDHGKIHPWSTYDIEIHEPSLLRDINRINASSICNKHTITLYKQVTTLQG